MSSVQGRFYYGVCGMQNKETRIDATAFIRREEEPFAIGARDERRRRHSGAPALRRYSATSLLSSSMACLRAVLPDLQRSE
jgi:hypothetical protein